jgi:hypothetical protein
MKSDPTVFEALPINYKLVLAWVVGMLMGVKAESITDWLLLIIFSLVLFASFYSLELQIENLRKSMKS